MKRIYCVILAAQLFALPAFANEDADEAQDFLWDTTPTEYKVDLADTGVPIVDQPGEAIVNLGGEVAEGVVDIGKIVFSPILALDYAINGLAQGDMGRFAEGLFLIPASPVMKTAGAVGHRVVEYGSDGINAASHGVTKTTEVLLGAPAAEFEENTFYSLPATHVDLPSFNAHRTDDTVGINECTNDCLTPGGGAGGLKR